LRLLCEEVRATIRSISSESGVWIEPPSTTQLLDALMSEFSQDEVWYAGVPGAGGDDAIFIIGRKNINLKDLIKNRFTNKRPNLAVLDLEITEPVDCTGPYGSLIVEDL
jgi:phosphomevalonate kinase